MKTYLFFHVGTDSKLLIVAEDFEQAKLKLEVVSNCNWNYEGMNNDLPEFDSSKYKNGISIKRKDFKVTSEIKWLLVQDDCASDSIDYFKKELLNNFGLRLNDFFDNGIRSDFGYIFNGYKIEQFPEEPYWHLSKQLI